MLLIIVDIQYKSSTNRETTIAEFASDISATAKLMFIGHPKRTRACRKHGRKVNSITLSCYFHLFDQCRCSFGPRTNMFSRPELFDEPQTTKITHRHGWRMGGLFVVNRKKAVGAHVSSPAEFRIT